ncbi:MAG: hypothetical protein N2235_09235 [Fischerella sp.]|nr:hypothetical protein [Fischerella sp.]
MCISVIFNFFLVEQALHSLALPDFIGSWVPHKDSAISVKQATIGTAFTKKIFQQSYSFVWGGKFF